MQKNTRPINIVFIIILTSIALTACTKTITAPNGSNNGNGTGTNLQSSLTFNNDTYTAITIVANGQTQMIQPGSSIIFKNSPGINFTGTASTSGLTSSGTQVGLQLSWDLNKIFPATGNLSTNLDAGSNYFFLYLINKSAKQMLQLYVNYGLQSQTTDNVTIPNDGKIYAIGYYNAYSNSNVRTENNATFWYWSTISLNGLVNQSATLTGN